MSPTDPRHPRRTDDPRDSGAELVGTRRANATDYLTNADADTGRERRPGSRGW